MKTCKTCIFWSSNNIKNNVSECLLFDMIMLDNPKNFAYIEANASDDQGLDAVFMTGSDFGCIQHKDKDDDNY